MELTEGVCEVLELLVKLLLDLRELLRLEVLEVYCKDRSV
jgi:hypothetical protein